MTLPKKHSDTTEKLIKAIPIKVIGKWFLEEGYYPEQYVVPPVFKVQEFKLNKNPYNKLSIVKGLSKFEPNKSELITVSFPKTQLTDRTFGIIEPQIYHDIVWYLLDNWSLILKSIFRKDNNIHSYSFPLPISKQKHGLLGDLRGGRMIYEFLEMAENDLVAEAYNYKFILKTDIKNFYPSVYTHSIAWAIHGKEEVRKKGNRSKFDKYVGLILDKLFQYSNDGCTNGIAIGPAVSDFISEVILTAVDTECSKLLASKNIDFIGTRFKDDYRFLCQSKHDANLIIKTLQKQMLNFNLHLNEKKCQIEELPEGLFREWTAEYIPYSLRYKKKISYKQFENSIRGTLYVDKKYEGCGVVDRFLSELYTNDYKLKFDFKEKNILKAISLLLLLKERRNKALPQILGIIERIIAKPIKSTTLDKIKTLFNNIIKEKIAHLEDNQYELIWLIYFVRTNDLFKIYYPKKIKSQLIKSIKNNKGELYTTSGAKLFETIKKPGKNKILLEHLSLFKKK